MKQFLERRRSSVRPDDNGKKPTKPGRVSGRVLWAVIFVWVILFLLIRLAFKLPGSPLVLFIVMFGLFFVALFLVRVSLLRLHSWWYDLRTLLVRLLAGSRRRK